MLELSTIAPTRICKHRSGADGRSHWTAEEDELLSKLVGGGQQVPWSSICHLFPGRSPSQLAGRWEKVLNPSLIKGAWTQEEDMKIVKFVSENGIHLWAKLALSLPGRTGKQCRERYKNHLDPNLNKSVWTTEEDKLLIQLHHEHGSAWTKIASHFPGRTDNCVKNRWNSTLKKRIERIEQGLPLVSKRGRKPKNRQAEAENQDLNSTTVTARQEVQSLFINFAAAFKHLIAPSTMEPDGSSFPSLEQNRTELKRLLYA